VVTEVLDNAGILWVRDDKPGWPWKVHDRDAWAKSSSVINDQWGPIVEWIE
jgi:hypothetical protein